MMMVDSAWMPCDLQGVASGAAADSHHKGAAVAQPPAAHQVSVDGVHAGQQSPVHAGQLLLLVSVWHCRAGQYNTIQYSTVRYMAAQMGAVDCCATAHWPTWSRVLSSASRCWTLPCRTDHDYAYRIQHQRGRHRHCSGAPVRLGCPKPNLMYLSFLAAPGCVEGCQATPTVIGSNRAAKRCATRCATGSQWPCGSSTPPAALPAHCPAALRPGVDIKLLAAMT